MDVIPVSVDLKTLYQLNDSVTGIVLLRFAGSGLGLLKNSLPTA
jgi:hypothetical protein